MQNSTGNSRRFSLKHLMAAVPAVAASAVIVSAGLIGQPNNAAAQELNIEEIFFCHEGEMTGEQTYEECVAARDTTLITCTACHVFTPFVKAQKTEQEWDTFMEAHRQRVKDASDEDYEAITKFLKAHFNPDNPVPELPPALENYTLPPA